jgi:NAD(P)-dependent dehydrogenase (short-subunit alcohol dehydrogenase family)
MEQTRTLLISGASRGIGRAIAERALAEGHRLSLGLRDPDALPEGPLREAARQRGDRLVVHPYDARDQPRRRPGWRRRWPTSARSTG